MSSLLFKSIPEQRPTRSNSSSRNTPEPPRNERHVKKPSIGHASIATRRSTDSCNNFAGPRTIWGTDDSFLPRAKPPPPLPRLENHRRTHSQRNIDSPSARSSTSHGTYQRPYATSNPSMHEYPVQGDQPQKPLLRTNTLATASSGTSSESVSKPPWKPPPCWAGPHAWADPDESKERKPARSLSRSRLGNLKRTPSHSRRGRGTPASRPKTPEPEVFQLVNVVGSEQDTDTQDRGRSLSTGVKIQCYEGWDEKPVEDVVHLLRELRFK